MGNYFFRRDPVEELVLPVSTEEVDAEVIENKVSEEEILVDAMILPENYY